MSDSACSRRRRMQATGAAAAEPDVGQTNKGTGRKVESNRNRSQLNANVGLTNWTGSSRDTTVDLTMVGS